MLPLSIVEAPSFKQFTKSLDPRFVVPSRKHLTTKLVAQKDELIKSKLVNILQLTETVSLTLDLWSNRQMRGFLGITCHFILNWSLKSAMLECKRFKGRHTAENIAQYYDEAITSYGIHSKIVTTITDNASNVVKAVSLPGFEDCELSDAEDEDDDGDSAPSADEQEDESDVEEFGESDGSGNPQLFLESEHDACFAHTLQLVVKDGLKQIGAIKKVLAKVHVATIVSHV